MEILYFLLVPAMLFLGIRGPHWLAKSIGKRHQEHVLGKLRGSLKDNESRKVEKTGMAVYKHTTNNSRTAWLLGGITGGGLLLGAVAVLGFLAEMMGAGSLSDMLLVLASVGAFPYGISSLYYLYATATEREGNHELVKQTTKMLANSEQPTAAELLGWGLRQPKGPEVRTFVAQQLRAHPHNAALPQLEEALFDSEPRVRKAALQTLLSIAPERLARHMPKMMDDRIESIRWVVLSQVNMAPREIQEKVLLAALLDSSSRIARQAIDYLRTHQIIEEQEWLNGISSQRTTMRLAAAIFLQTSSHEQAPSLLLKALQSDKSYEVRAAAARSLGTLRYAQAAESLAGLLGQLTAEEDKGELRAACVEALIALGEYSKPHMDKLLASDAEMVLEAALEVLSHIDDGGFVQQVQPLVEGASARVRKAALLYMERMSSPEVRAAQLSRALRDKDEQVRTEAISRLWDVPDTRTLPALLELAKQLHVGAIVGIAGAVPAIKKRQEEHERVLDVLKKTLALQQGLHRTYPNIYCMRTHSRAELYTATESQAGMDVAFVLSRLGGDDTDLKGGIKKVHGTLGDGQGQRVDELLTLHLPLWDAERQKALAADIDALYIYGGQQALNYDWAVAAIVTELQNRREGRDLSIHLVDGPKLSANSLHQLQEIGFIDEGEEVLDQPN